MASGTCCAGVGTLIQSLGVSMVGIRMPVVMGSSFVTVGPMVAMASGGQIGIAGCAKQRVKKPMAPTRMGVVCVRGAAGHAESMC